MELKWLCVCSSYFIYKPHPTPIPQLRYLGWFSLFKLVQETAPAGFRALSSGLEISRVISSACWLCFWEDPATVPAPSKSSPFLQNEKFQSFSFSGGYGHFQGTGSLWDPPMQGETVLHSNKALKQPEPPSHIFNPFFPCSGAETPFQKGIFVILSSSDLFCL